MTLAQELAAALKWMVELCHHANPGAFSNGVTDQTGSIDEGNVRASEIIGEARAALARAAAEGALVDENAASLETLNPLFAGILAAHLHKRD